MHSKNRIPQHQTLRQVKIYISLFLFHHLEYVFTTNSISSLQLELNKIRSKVQEKDMSREPAQQNDQWQTFFENYKPIRVWLWFVYKITENICRSRLIAEISYLPFQNKFSNLKTSGHFKLKFVL